VQDTFLCSVKKAFWLRATGKALRRLLSIAGYGMVIRA
jgi:hypothetical protein